MFEHSPNGPSIWRDESASPAAALFEARERIEHLEEIKLRQGGKILALVLENATLTERANDELGGRYGRLCDGIFAIESFTSKCMQISFKPGPELMQELLRDTIDYGESGRLSELLGVTLEEARLDLDSGTSEAEGWEDS